MATTGFLSEYDKLPFQQTNNSQDSFGRGAWEFGEGWVLESDRPLYPFLIPVYNGRPLDIPPQFVHASLSGISMKHYYGRCCEEEERNEHKESYWHEEEEFDWSEMNHSSVSEETKSTESSYKEGRPLCTVPKLNFRNSFWNLHRPELCKLTWGQKYVSTATVTEHLHGHLVQHGPLCEGLHTEEERQQLLDKELDEYVRLKVLASPRDIPPDEPFFPTVTIQRAKTSAKCRTTGKPDIKIPFDVKSLFIQFEEDDGETAVKNVHRLKEEFCLTIGKQKREEMIVKSVISLPSEVESLPLTEEIEEEGEHFYFDWHVSEAEEVFVKFTELSSVSQTITPSESESVAPPCGPLIMDEFCRAAGKVDFSDMRPCPDL